MKWIYFNAKESWSKFRSEGLISGLQFLIVSSLHQQFVRFCIVGSIGVTFNYSIFVIMLYFLKIDYIISSATGFILAIFVAYTLNKLFTFKVKHARHRENIKALIKYSLVCLFSLVLGLSILWVLVEIINLNPYVSNVLNIGVTTFSNYFGSKYIVFRRSKQYD